MGKNSNLDTLGRLKLHLLGKVVILGMGNTLRSDDGVGSILVNRIKDKIPHLTYDGNSSPENYLGKIIKDKPDNILIIDAVDFGGLPGEFRVLEGENIETVNFFSTHNASISLAINYLKKTLTRVDIIILAIQPKTITFGDNLSPEIIRTLEKLEGWFVNG
ncbi:MAG: hydrogenase 3 maturation endopeptidase HyCI [Candidatus Omnitrophica bacterium CG08_land_8_20_14_0_20_41_16]|uniref:Hydrogenase 3 maturation endopeptidase HyCI n=1 Tax=Candidatus Sherwoodlollariibacterium unditelluris TaxID=1974757 RepID=A0A2G9YJR7_9BACT|nr:MAG: hydrogenase 3 maturation endopeptidase HyCI [Candidatus Omnitrophica bacterium CG23_combo_of_CG06-09_8_20_14_all_41_10]PIS33482.1 MAG: hydrogenase 3 maturation endopeptidase HyCI [Candidatus Omnitrophica bacterium CG08_land_8_20_14_0_20_41_16]